MFTPKNNNPKNKKTCDCVIKALTEVTDKSVEEIITELTTIYINKGWFINDPKCYDIWLKDNGYEKQNRPKFPDGKKYTGNEFCEYLNTLGITDTILAHIGAHHITVFKHTEEGYAVQDAWNCSDYCVGNWWKPVVK